MATTAWADRYAVIYLSNSGTLLDMAQRMLHSQTINLGSLVAFNSNVTFKGYARFVNNQPPQTTTGDFQEGGAITTSVSKYKLYYCVYIMAELRTRN